MPKISELPLATSANSTDVLALYDPNGSPVSRQIEVQNVAVNSPTSVGKLYGVGASGVVLAEEPSVNTPATTPTDITGYASKTGGATVNQALGTITVPNSAAYRIIASVLMERIAGANSAEVFLELIVNSVRYQLGAYEQPSLSSYVFIPIECSLVKDLSANDVLKLAAYTTAAFTAHTVDFISAFFEVETFYG